MDVYMFHLWNGDYTLRVGFIYSMAYGAVLSVQYSSFFSLLYTYYVTFTILWLGCPFKSNGGDYKV